MVAGIIILALALTAIRLYQVYEPLLDVIEMGGHRYLIVWYNRRGVEGSRDYKRIFQLKNG
jgi:hypothetical protein